jgi:cytochrome P450
MIASQVAGGAEAGHDPFEAFNRRQGLGLVRDPYRQWAELRRQAPVHRLHVRDLLGREGPVPVLGSEVYVAFSFDAVVDILRDGETFSSAGYGRTMGLVLGRTILEMDEPEHFRHRALLQKAFTHKGLRRFEQRIIVPAVQRRVAALRGRGRADLVRDLTFPFPVAVIAEMIGLPEEAHAAFHRLAVELISVAFDPARGIAASRTLREMFLSLLAERRVRPREDLASELAHAELDGERLDDEAIVSFLRLLAPAGAETTYRSSSNLLFGLLRHPEQLEALRRDHTLIPQAIEEGLRWECPLTFILRTARYDARVRGVPIPQGATVGVNLAAANRDETRWPQPDRFDVFRPPRAHAAFAFGPHTCLGKHLARVETRVVVETLLDALPGLRLDPACEDVQVTGYTFRSPLALPVLFDA